MNSTIEKSLRFDSRISMAKTTMEELNKLISEGVTDLDLDFDDDEKEEPKAEVKEEKPKVEVKEEKKVEHPKPFISDTFSKLMNEVETEKEIKREKTAEELTTAKDILSNIKIDLSSIEIVENVNPLQLLKNQKEVLGATKVMQVVCCQSAYSAEISALRNQEIQNINNMNTDLYTFKKRLYRALWTHLETTSVGKMDFDTWMRVTSFFDVETLLYGAYCMTFPYQNKYPVRCPKHDCTHNFDIIVDNNSLIETRGRDKEIFAKINEVISNVDKASDLINHSHVHTTERLILEESKIIVDIQIPSVYDYLEGILHKVQNQEEYAEEHANSLGLAMFIKQFLIPDIDGLKQTGQLRYMPFTDQSKFVEMVSNLPYFDGEDLSKHVNSFSERLHISYSIKGVVCPKCGYNFPAIPMDMENVLFTAIRLGRRD